MRIFKNKWFVRFARKERIINAKLCEAVSEAERGAIHADYGGGVIKQRISRPNEGKSGGYRVIILYRHGSRAFFVYGFAKNDRGNLNEEEEKLFKEAAKINLAFSDKQLTELVTQGIFEEVDCDE